ncbi:CDP-glucose 4,6-dehydratase [Synechococcus sp. CC9616]|uniref:CDP-glucose 4,6-dehydratase n=1 Tax=Synechococcus sp. CC9616 TaxID=110663 RepID=UPI000686B76F|nr:CDP-glucose 4,6-dehydratase [Synechococcus sp. CC9616]
MLSKDFWRGCRVLLTGHTGFKGSWLTLWLLSLGAEVWGYSLEPEGAPNLFQTLVLDKPSFGQFPGSLHHRIGDLHDLPALQQLVSESRPQVVLHLAAQPLVRLSYHQPLLTWSTNVQGCLHLLEAIKPLRHPCSVVMVTTDKVYENREWDHGYREMDRLGGLDPYSASKAAAELAIASWRASFCGLAAHQTSHLAISTARAGNVIGGGDWAADRLLPDAMRAVAAGEPVIVRSPEATRPWQHVLEPLGGYLLLAQRLSENPSDLSNAFNFGPLLEANRSVSQLLEAVFQYWPGEWVDRSDPEAPHEAGRLHLQIDSAYHELGWRPCWPFQKTVERSVNWYRRVAQGQNPLDCCLEDLKAYQEAMGCGR